MHKAVMLMLIAPPTKARGLALTLDAIRETTNVDIELPHFTSTMKNGGR
jgi:hypothetical protein